MQKKQSNHIIMTPGVVFGKPRIQGTRISVEQVLQCLSEGWRSSQKIIKEFPMLTKEDIRACIAYANTLVSNTHVTGDHSNSEGISLNAS